MGTLNLTAIVLLLVGGIIVYIAYCNPAMGTPILTGAGVMTLLTLLLGKNSDTK
jgi:hypothetical protein